MAKAGEMNTQELNTDGLSEEEIKALEDSEEAGSEAEAKAAEEAAAAARAELEKKVESGDDEAKAELEKLDKEAEEAAAKKAAEEEEKRLAAMTDEERTAEEAKKAAEEEAAKKKAEEEAKAAEEEAAAAKQQQQPRTFVPKMEANPDRIKEIDTRVTDIDTKIDELGKKMEEGDMEFPDYHKEFTKLNKEQSQLLVERGQLELAEKQNSMTADQVWQHEQETFFGQAGNSVLQQIGPVREAMNTAVIELANDKANADRTGAWVLEEAKKRIVADEALVKEVKEQLGIDVTTLPAWQGGKKMEKEEHPEKKPDPPETGPNTLRQTPAAADTDADGEERDAEFAALDKLIDEGDVIEYESQLAAMPKHRQDQYLNVGHPGAPGMKQG